MLSIVGRKSSGNIQHCFLIRKERRGREKRRRRTKRRRKKGLNK
jgi:hypothetical protein